MPQPVPGRAVSPAGVNHHLTIDQTNHLTRDQRGDQRDQASQADPEAMKQRIKARTQARAAAQGPPQRQGGDPGESESPVKEEAQRRHKEGQRAAEGSPPGLFPKGRATRPPNVTLNGGQSSESRAAAALALQAGLRGRQVRGQLKSSP